MCYLVKRLAEIHHYRVHLLSVVYMFSHFLSKINKLGLTRALGSEPVLSVRKYVVTLKMSGEVANDDMFHYFTANTGQRDWPVVTGLEF